MPRLLSGGGEIDNCQTQKRDYEHSAPAERRLFYFGHQTGQFGWQLPHKAELPMRARLDPVFQTKDMRTAAQTAIDQIPEIIGFAAPFIFKEQECLADRLDPHRPLARTLCIAVPDGNSLIHNYLSIYYSMLYRFYHNNLAEWLRLHPACLPLIPSFPRRRESLEDAVPVVQRFPPSRE